MKPLSVIRYKPKPECWDGALKYIKEGCAAGQVEYPESTYILSRMDDEIVQVWINPSVDSVVDQQDEGCCQRNSNWSLSTTIRSHYEAQSWNHAERAAQRFCM